MAVAMLFNKYANIRLFVVLKFREFSIGNHHQFFRMSTKSGPTYLDGDMVSKCMEGQWKTLVPLIEKGFKSFSEGKVVQPVRTTVHVRKYNGALQTMPAYDTESDILATKILTAYSENKSKGLPTIQSIVLLYNASDGTLKAIMDAHVITNMRTAAASMVATKYLARKESEYTIAILGSGAQGQIHYHATKHFYEIKKVCVWDVNKEMGSKFVNEIKHDGKDSDFCSTVEEAVKEADIIHVATLATKPILMKKWVKEGIHINAVGAAGPEKQELDEDLMKSSIVYVDSIKGASTEAGDIVITGADIYAEIGEVVAGRKEAFPNKTTIFKTVGMAEEDLVAANMAYENYCKQKEKAS